MFGESGQASVEYALVTVALMVSIAALAAIWHYAADGSMGHLVEQAASHAVTQIGGMADVLLY